MRALWLTVVGLLAMAAGACDSGSSSAKTGIDGAAASKGEVVVYTALDRQFSEPIFAAFTEKTGIVVKPVFDTEAAKTVGLVNRLLAERQRPVADVFWNNEIIRSIQLKTEGLTEAYVSPAAASIPEEYRDPEGHWTGFAARGRVLLVNTTKLPDPAGWPTRVAELTDPKWRGQAAFAKPLFGTTATHAAWLWVRDGGEASTTFWKKAAANGVMMAGNAQARDAAASGEVAWCLTDTDDAVGAIEDGAPVKIVWPADDALLIPNTIVLVKGAPNPANARALIDYVVSEEVERALSTSRSAQFPVRAGLPPPAGLEPIDEGRRIDVDWPAVATALPPCAAALTQALGSGPLP